MIRFHAMVLITGCLLVMAPPGVRSEEIVVRPEAAEGPLDNPLKGWCPYTSAGQIGQPYSMVFVYVPWKTLEPAEGDFRFEEWEKRAWSVKTARDKWIVPRVYIDYPGKPSGLPDWLKSQVKLTDYKDHGGGKSPDYDNPVMVDAMERFILAMGRRYDSNPRIAFIQLGMLGHWGEWHTWPQEHLYASPATEQRVIDAFHQAFPNKMLQVRYARDYAGKQPWIGFHDDMFPEDIDNGKDWSFLAGMKSTGRLDNWKVAAIGGEMVPNQAARWLGPQWETTERATERSHFTWVGPYCPALEESNNPEFLAMSQKLVRKLGYQYRLAEIRHDGQTAKGEPIHLTLKGINEGVAPFYYPWSVEAAFLDPSGKPVAQCPLDCDLRTWLPGSFEVKALLKPDLPPGRYGVALGIIDPWKNQPAIRFANRLETREGWTVLSELEVKP